MMTGWLKGKGLFCLSRTQRCYIAPQSLCIGYWMLLWLVGLAPEWTPNSDLPCPYGVLNPEDYFDKNNVVGIAYFFQQSNDFVKVSIDINNCNSNSSQHQGLRTQKIIETQKSNCKSLSISAFKYLLIAYIWTAQSNLSTKSQHKPWKYWIPIDCFDTTFYKWIT